MPLRHKKNQTRLVNFYCPVELDAALKYGARKTDSDKSKFVRSAIREKLARHGVHVPAQLENV